MESTLIHLIPRDDQCGLQLQTCSFSFPSSPLAHHRRAALRLQSFRRVGGWTHQSDRKSGNDCLRKGFNFILHCYRPTPNFSICGPGNNLLPIVSFGNMAQRAEPVRSEDLGQPPRHLQGVSQILYWASFQQFWPSRSNEVHSSSSFQPILGP